MKYLPLILVVLLFFTNPAYSKKLNKPDTPPKIVSLLAKSDSNEVKIIYTISDKENDNCSIEVSYSLDNGITFHKINSITGNVKNVKLNVPNTIIWNFNKEINLVSSNLIIRIVPRDGYLEGDECLSNKISISNNHPPEITKLVKIGYCGEIILIYDIVDKENHPCSVELQYTTDEINFIKAPFVKGDLNNIFESNNRRIEWDTRQIIKKNNVKLRLIPSDPYSVGSPAIVPFFTIDNLALPVVSNVNIVGDSGTIEVKFHLKSHNNDKCGLSLSLSTDNGKTFSTVEYYEKKFKNGNNSILWDSSSFFRINMKNLKLRLVANDCYVNGPFCDSKSFALNNFNSLYFYGSEIMDLKTTGNMGDILIDFGISGEVGISYDVDFDYTIDNGKTWNSCSKIKGKRKDLKIGLHKVTWASGEDIVGKTTVSVRLSPYTIFGCEEHEEYQRGIIGVTPNFVIKNDLLPVVKILRLDILEEPYISLTYSVTNKCRWINKNSSWKIDLVYFKEGETPVKIDSKDITGICSGKNSGTSIYKCKFKLPEKDLLNIYIGIIPYMGNGEIRGKLAKIGLNSFYYQKLSEVKIISITDMNDKIIDFNNPAVLKMKINFKIIDKNKDNSELMIFYKKSNSKTKYKLVDPEHFYPSIFSGNDFYNLSLPFKSGTNENSAPTNTIVWQLDLDFGYDNLNIDICMKARNSNKRRKFGALSYYKNIPVKNSPSSSLPVEYNEFGNNGKEINSELLNFDERKYRMKLYYKTEKNKKFKEIFIPTEKDFRENKIKSYDSNNIITLCSLYDESSLRDFTNKSCRFDKSLSWAPSEMIYKELGKNKKIKLKIVIYNKSNNKIRDVRYTDWFYLTKEKLPYIKINSVKGSSGDISFNCKIIGSKIKKCGVYLEYRLYTSPEFVKGSLGGQYKKMDNKNICRFVWHSKKDIKKNVKHVTFRLRPYIYEEKKSDSYIYGVYKWSGLKKLDNGK